MPKVHVADLANPAPSEASLFYPDQLENFWAFVYERQSIWQRRARLKLPRPWTSDRVLQEERFANVYRELDPGTIHVVAAVLEADAPPEAVIFSTAAYRMMGSREDTQVDLGLLDPREFDAAAFALQLLHLQKKHPIAGAAYRVCAYSSYGKPSFFENLAAVLDDVAYMMPRTWKKLREADRPSQWYKVLRELPGFGPFLAYQVLNDLTYPLHKLDGVPLLRVGRGQKPAHDGFAQAGPGARLGLKRLTGTDTDQFRKMLFLRQDQSRAWVDLQLDFEAVAPTWAELFPNLERSDLSSGVGVDPDGVAEIDLSNVEGCLCEFYKYTGISDGSVRGRRKFWTPPFISVTRGAICSRCNIRQLNAVFVVTVPNGLPTSVCQSCAVGLLLTDLLPNEEEAPVDEEPELSEEAE